MAALPDRVATAITLTPLRQPLEIREKFTLTVDTGEKHTVAGRVVKLVGLRLIAQLSEYLRTETCIRIDCDDAVLLGEVIGCLREGDATCVIDLQQAVVGLRKLATYMQQPALALRPFKQPRCA
jgi:hypothetical protein